MKRSLKRKRGKPSAKPAARNKNRLAVYAFLLILFPLFFWLTVLLKFELGIGAPFNFWNLFYEDYLEFFLLLFTLPAFFIGLIAYFRGRKRRSGALLAAMTVGASILSGIAWAIAAQRPG